VPGLRLPRPPPDRGDPDRRRVVDQQRETRYFRLRIRQDRPLVRIERAHPLRPRRDAGEPREHPVPEPRPAHLGREDCGGHPGPRRVQPTVTTNAVPPIDGRLPI
jgi:hypothetical protein